MLKIHINIGQINLKTLPVPRAWSFPSGFKFLPSSMHIVNCQKKPFATFFNILYDNLSGIYFVIRQFKKSLIPWRAQKILKMVQNIIFEYIFLIIPNYQKLHRKKLEISFKFIRGTGTVPNLKNLILKTSLTNIKFLFILLHVVPKIVLYCLFL